MMAFTKFISLFAFCVVVAPLSYASTYHVPVPEQFGPFATMPVDANFRLRLDKDEVVLTYSIPNELNGSESLGLRLKAPLAGRTSFQPGEAIDMVGKFDDREDDPNASAYAKCTFEIYDRVSCAVNYSEIGLNESAQLTWLQAKNHTPEQIAAFQEVAMILGHEALGIVSTEVQIRGQP